MSNIATKFIVGQVNPNDPASDWIYLKILRSSGTDVALVKMAEAANDQDRAVLDAVRVAFGKAGLKRAA